MSRLIRFTKRVLTVVWRPNPDERSFLDRAQTRTEDGLTVTVSVLSIREAERFFGVRMGRRGMQPVWLEIVNNSPHPVRLEPYALDPKYYTALEAAYVNHFSMGKRLLGFGLLAWLFFILLPLIPFKFFGARRANRRINEFFKQHAFRSGPITASRTSSGFVFTSLDEGSKAVNVRLISHQRVWDFDFSCEVPGLDVQPGEIDAAEPADLEPLDGDALAVWLQQQPACTTNRTGTVPGDPLNLVVVGDQGTVRQCFGARWDDAESISLATCWKTAKAFLFSAQYRYSPVSPLYVDGRVEDLALQMARASINERIHLRLWRTNKKFKGQQIWIGQISRDIGVRFTPKTWNLTTHKIDDDVDEARDYVADFLLASANVSDVGYVDGVVAAPTTAPRRNLTGDPYYTDGRRVVLVLSRSKTKASFIT